MLRKLALSVLATILSSAAQRKPMSVPDGDLPTDWHSVPPTFTLTPSGPAARRGQVWVRKSPTGLLIAGHVDGPAPVFPKSAEELMGKDHVEIWMAVDPTPQMPVMGWGNQFGDTELPKGELSCSEANGNDGDKLDKESVEACRAWAIKQKSYRIHLRRLFARQWQLSPKIGVESFASMAYQEIEKMVAGSTPDRGIESPKLLNPQGVPELKVSTKSGVGYDFETLVPWTMFPPVANLSLQDIFLMVEVFSAAPPGRKMGPYSTTSPGRGYAEFTAFSRIRFDHPREYQVSPCRYPLVGEDFYDELKKGFFFPADKQLISDMFVLDNFRAGYAYGPSGFSPEARPSHFFAREIASGEFLCGPVLRYFAAGRGTNLEITSQEVTTQLVVAEPDLDVQRLPGGAMLLRNGPRTFWSKFGSGQCGACERVELVIYSVDRDLKISELFRSFDVVGNDVSDMDIQVSTDWTRVGVYRHKLDAESDTWDDEFYCLKDGSYLKCGTGHTPPPEPRKLKLNAVDQ